MLLVLYVSRAWATTGARVFGSTVWGPNLGAYTGPQWPLTRGRLAAPLILSLPVLWGLRSAWADAYAAIIGTTEVRIAPLRQQGTVIVAGG